MSSNSIDAIHIFDYTNQLILEHIYRGRPPTARALLALYLSHPAPRPSLIYSHETSPPTLIFSLQHANLLFLVPSSKEVEPLFVLEFLHRLCDVLEDFLGSPLLPTKIESSYDVVAQLLGEMCDAGNVSTTEPNALRDVVERPGWVDKLLSGVKLPGSSSSSSSLQTQSSSFRAQIALHNPQLGPAIPWRRANVKHTSNELYVDIVETLAVILAPSGRPISAFVHGSILFTAKVSGVPDLLLGLSVPSGKHTIPHILELPTFHPCVRLARWKDHPGELSFVPPDGKFLLAGYEVNLLPTNDWTSRNSAQKTLPLPAAVEMSTSLGSAGLDFEARLTIHLPASNSNIPSSNTQSSRLSSSHGPGFRGGGSNSTTSSFFTNTSSATTPTIQDVLVTIPIPHSVRNILDLKASRGEANFSTTDHEVEWRLNSKESAAAGTATLRCTVVGPLHDDAGEIDAAAGILADVNGVYVAEDETVLPSRNHQQSYVPDGNSTTKGAAAESRDVRKVEANRGLMPSSAAVSFSVKGWLPSGVRVDSLVVDVKRSKGLGEGIKPVKGAKYLTVSRKGVETRC